MKLRAIKGRKAFTLVELIAVMAIVVLLTGVGTVAFRDLRSTGISTSAAQVSSALSMARDLAVTSNRRVRFAIVAEGGGSPDDWQMRSYGVLQETDLASGSFKVAMPFKQLPAGVYFGRDQENEAIGGGVFGSTSDDPVDVQGKSVDYAYIEFLPTGGTKDASGSNIFSIAGGAGAEKPIANNTNYARLGVAQHTGRVRVERPE